MGHHLKALREEFAIQNIDTTVMLSRTVRYDKIHLEDEPINRKLITSFLRAAVDVHLSYLKLIGADDSLRLKPRLEDLEEQKSYPNLTSLRIAFKQELESNVSSPAELPPRPDLEKATIEADAEIVTQLFAPYLQHFVMTIGQMFMQTGFNLWLSSLFLTRGEGGLLLVDGGRSSLLPGPGLANARLGTAVEVGSLQSLWLLLCTFLVVSMQLGFAMLEVGGVREAHRMTVLAKNLGGSKNVMDSVVTCLAFALATRFWNLTLVQDANGAESYESLLSNWAFCGAKKIQWFILCELRICSGAMAERAHMLAYLAYAAVMGCVVYPPLAEGVWGRGGSFLYDQLHGRFRDGISYHDCAGSGVVHWLQDLNSTLPTLTYCVHIGPKEIVA
eukprot:s5238_g1.t1